MDVCVLSRTEAARLENLAIWPRCKEHWHVKKREALQMVTAETHRFVGGADTKAQSPVSMIVPVVVGREWTPQPSSGLMGFRVWGLAPSK